MLRDLMFRLRALFRRTAVEQELEQELQFHFDNEVNKLRSAGVPEQDARRRARIAIGGVEQIKEECRDARGTRLLETTLQDMRYALRILRKDRGFTTVAIISLALGIGANTAIFTLINAVLLKSLPVKEPEQLFVIGHAGERGVDEAMNFRLFETFRERTDSFSGLLLFNPNQWKIDIGGDVQIAYGQCVTTNYFEALGVSSLLGRTLSQLDDGPPGSSAVAVLGYAYWQRRFGGSHDVLGSTIRVNQIPFTVVGVTGPEFFGLEAGRQMDITVPMSMHSLVGSGMSLTETRGFTRAFTAVGRLRKTRSSDQALAETDVVFQQYLKEWMPGFAAESRRGLFQTAALVPASSGVMQLRKQFSKPLHVLMGMVGLVLLIACANVANLLIAKTGSRERELSVRLAIGADRSRVIRQLLTESVLLSIFSGLIGMGIAIAGSHFLLTFLPQGSVPFTLSVDPDMRVLAFALAVSVVTGIVFGLAPAWRNAKAELSMKLTNRHPSGVRRSGALGRLMVVAQVAISFVLITAAALFGLSLYHLRQVDLGFAHDVALADVDYQGTGRGGLEIQQSIRALAEQLRQIPGAISVSYSVVTPLGGSWEGRNVSVPGTALTEGEFAEVRANWIGPGYFSTLGTPLVAGRDFTDKDDDRAHRVAIIGESFSRHFFQGRNPIGARVVLKGSAAIPMEIVGVVKDMRYDGMREQSPRVLYIPAMQEPHPRPYATFLVRSSNPPSNLLSTVEQQMRAADRSVPVSRVRTLSRQVDDSLAQDRLLATLGGFFTLLAVVLVTAGLYGVMAFSVVRRTNEIGIRIALGARFMRVLWMILRDAAILIGLGTFIGVPAAFIVGRQLSGLLFHARVEQPAILAFTIALLLATGLIAAALPAMRAAKLNPVEALRAE